MAVWRLVTATRVAHAAPLVTVMLPLEATVGAALGALLATGPSPMAARVAHGGSATNFVATNPAVPEAKDEVSAAHC